MPDYPISQFSLTFPGEVAFRVVETKESRSLGGDYTVIYNAFAQPLDDLFTKVLGLGGPQGEDEVIIAWNVWLNAGLHMFNGALIKKWPPRCERITHNSYKVSIKYGPLFDVNFQTTPVSVKKDISIKSRRYSWVAGKFIKCAENDSDRIIMADEESRKPTGVKVYEPTLTWTEQWTWGPVSDSQGYELTLSNQTAKINNAMFRGFPQRTVIFLGAICRHTQPFTREIDYRFSYRPVPYKGTYVLEEQFPPWASGWDVIETPTYAGELIEGGKKYIVQEPTFLKIHKVYYEASFADLRIYPGIELGNSAAAALLSNVPQIGFPATPALIAGYQPLD